MVKESSDKNTKWLRSLEIIIVVVILMILLGIAFLISELNQAQARNAKRISEVNKLRTVLQFHYLDKGNYPVQAEWCYLELDCNALAEGIKPYLKELPRDPLYPREGGGRIYSYQYRTTADGQEYKIHVELERQECYELGSKGSFKIPSP